MSRKRSTRIIRQPIVPFAGLSVAEDENWLTGRRVWVARYNDHAGFSDSCPLVACAEAMEHAARVFVPTRENDHEAQRVEG